MGQCLLKCLGFYAVNYSKFVGDPTPHGRGRHEIAELDTEAGGPLTSSDECSKNPGHPGFTSIGDLDVNLVMPLPQGLGNEFKEDMVELVKCVATYVVRLCVYEVSPDRPETWKDGTPYPYFDQRGKAVCLAGSGWVRFVSGPFYDQCSCKDVCSSENQGRLGYWKVQIYTARHVVFDDNEARKLEVVLFDDGSSVQHTLTTGLVMEASTEKDFCIMVFCVHDENVGTKLVDHWVRNDAKHIIDRSFQRWHESLPQNLKKIIPKVIAKWNETRSRTAVIKESVNNKGRLEEIDNKLRQMHKQFKDGWEETDASIKDELTGLYLERMEVDERIRHSEVLDQAVDENVEEEIKQLDAIRKRQTSLLLFIDSLIKYRYDGNFQLPVVVVSHPHGRMKYLSLGKYLGLDVGKVLSFKYAASTCAGCSGGAVIPIVALFLLKLKESAGAAYHSRLTMFSHSAALTETVGCCCARIDVFTD